MEQGGAVRTAAPAAPAPAPAMQRAVIAEGFSQAFGGNGDTEHREAFLAALSGLALRKDKPWAHVQRVACDAAQHRMMQQGAAGLPPVYRPVLASAPEVQDLITAFVDMLVEQQVISGAWPPTVFVVPSVVCCALEA